MYVKSTSAQPQLKSTLIKGFISRAKQIERNLRNGFVDERFVGVLNSKKSLRCGFM